jgi:hypothetical protein
MTTIRTGYRVSADKYNDKSNLRLEEVEWKVTDKRIATVQQGNGSGSNWTPQQWLLAGWRWTREEATTAFLESEHKYKARVETDLAQAIERIRKAEAALARLTEATPANVGEQ